MAVTAGLRPIEHPKSSANYPTIAVQRPIKASEIRKEG
jgi:hypothetical protein